MRTPALEPKNRITLPMRRVVAFELGCDTAKAGLPLDSFFHRDGDEQEAYEAGWRTEVTHEALSAGRLAEAEDADVARLGTQVHFLEVRCFSSLSRRRSRWRSNQISNSILATK